MKLVVACGAVLLMGMAQSAAAAPLDPEGLTISVTDSAAQVQVLVWPNAVALEKLPGGVSVPIRSVPVHASGSGTFTADLSGLPSDYVEGNSVNYELRTLGARSLQWFGVKQQGIASAEDKLTVDTSAAEVRRSSGPVESVGAFGARTSGAATDPTSHMLTMKQPTAANLVAGPDVADACGTSTTSTYKNNIRELFASAFAWSGAKVVVDFNSGSSHTLGIAAGGGQSGTSSISTSSGSTTAPFYDKYPVNKVNYRKYINLCTGEYWRPSSFYAILPSGEFVSASHSNYGYCNKYVNGDTPYKQSVKNITYSTGVSFPGGSVSAQSGWNTATKMKFVVTATSAICGSTSSGWANSPAASSRKW